MQLRLPALSFFVCFKIVTKNVLLPQNTWDSIPSVERRHQLWNYLDVQWADKAKATSRFKGLMRSHAAKYNALKNTGTSFPMHETKHKTKYCCVCHTKRWTFLYYLVKHIFPVPKRSRLRHLNTSARLLRGWLEVTEHMVFWVNREPLRRYLKSFGIYKPIRSPLGSDTIAWGSEHVTSA